MCRFLGFRVYARLHRHTPWPLCWEPRATSDTGRLMCRYQINHEVGFTSGQRAYSDYLQISDDVTRVKLLNSEAETLGASCMQSHSHQVCKPRKAPFPASSAQSVPQHPSSPGRACPTCQSAASRWSLPHSGRWPHTRSAMHFMHRRSRQPAVHVRLGVTEKAEVPSTDSKTEVSPPDILGC